MGTHIETTGPEIWEDTDGKVDIFVAGFVPDVLDTKIYDEIIAVENEAAFSMGKLMGTKERCSGWYFFRCCVVGCNSDC